MKNLQKLLGSTPYKQIIAIFIGCIICISASIFWVSIETMLLFQLCFFVISHGLLFFLHGTTKRPWLTKLIARITGGIPVELCASKGPTYCTIAQELKGTGLLIAHVYWFTGTGNVILERNGTVDSWDCGAFICAWLPLDKDQRVQHILAYGTPAID